tara:strand:+ start:1356 stop:1757 length:402 start_codon:yes stop_codon:yes gene_type:complete
MRLVPDEEKELHFDYDKINKQHLAAVKDVLQIIQSRPDVPISFIVEEIKQRYKIVEIPEQDLKKSLWYQLSEEFVHSGMKPVVHGHSIKVKDGHKIKVPIISVSADLDKFDEFAKQLVFKIQGDISDKDKTSK